MGEYLREQADLHTVKHQFSGKSHFFEVTSGESDEKYNVSIKINCDCKFTGVKGQANGQICSHSLAVLREIINRGDLQITHDENVQEKRNACKQLVRMGNRELNLIRYGDNEGKAHQIKKWEICMELLREKKQFYTEAIIDSVGLRLDILNLDNFEAIEIIDSESELSIKNKKKKCKLLGLSVKMVSV